LLLGFGRLASDQEAVEDEAATAARDEQAAEPPVAGQREPVEPTVARRVTREA
jgi:hypothetical protein